MKRDPAPGPPVLDSEQQIVEKRADLKIAERNISQIQAENAARSRPSSPSPKPATWPNVTDRLTKALDEKFRELDQDITKARQKESYSPSGGAGRRHRAGAEDTHARRGRHHGRHADDHRSRRCRHRDRLPRAEQGHRLRQRGPGCRDQARSVPFHALRSGAGPGAQTRPRRRHCSERRIRHRAEPDGRDGRRPASSPCLSCPGDVAAGLRFWSTASTSQSAPACVSPPRSRPATAA